MKKRSGFYPSLRADAGGRSVVSHAGGLLLTRTVAAAGLDTALSTALAGWRKPFAVHDPAKVVTDLAIALCLGGDCLADIASLRGNESVYGRVASDPTVSRTITALAADPAKALAAINTARAQARAQVWAAAGEYGPDHRSGQGRDSAEDPVIIDLDATLVTSHSDKEKAAGTFKRGFGHHPLLSFLDHGAAGTGEPLSWLLRPGNAGSNTAADHIAVTREALKQLPTHRSGTRPGRRVLIRADGAGCSHAFVAWLEAQRLSYSVGFTLPTDFGSKLTLIPESVWTPAYDSNGAIREGAWVAEVTGLLNLQTWPAGMRVVVRKERPHPGAQLRITDVEGHRVTAFATNTRKGQLPDLELRHRRRARCEDRIRCAKDTGLTNLPLHGFDQNQIWCAIVALAGDLQAWSQMLAFPTHPARRWEPKRLRLRLLSAAGRLVRTGRTTTVRMHTHGAWTPLILEGLNTLAALAAKPVQTVPG